MRLHCVARVDESRLLYRNRCESSALSCAQKVPSERLPRPAVRGPDAPSTLSATSRHCILEIGYALAMIAGWHPNV